MSGRWHHLYASNRWRVASERFRSTPEGCLCVDCKAAGRVTASEHVDHVIPHEGDLDLFWDPGNWAGRCHSCHSTKTHDDKYRKRHGKKRPKKGSDVFGNPLDEDWPGW